MHALPTFLPRSAYASVVCLQADVSADDMLQDDDITPLGEVPDCDALDAPQAIYSAKALCLSNADADTKCPDNSYGVMVVEDGAVNAFNEKLEAFKVCGLCPAGTFGDGFGCSSCAAGTISAIGGSCEDCPAGTYSNAGGFDMVWRGVGRWRGTGVGCCRVHELGLWFGEEDGMSRAVVASWCKGGVHSRLRTGGQK